MMTTELDTTDVDMGPELNQMLDRVAADPDLRVSVLNKLLGEGASRHIGIYPLPAGFKLSVVIPVYNEAASLPALREALTPVLDAIGLASEVILVDDGSSDDSWAAIFAWHAADPRVRALRFARNFGKEAALSAGIFHALGAAAREGRQHEGDAVLRRRAGHPPARFTPRGARWPRCARCWRRRDKDASAG